MPLVSIRKSDNGIEQALAECLDDIGGASRMFSKDDRVLIKPNLNDDVCYTNKKLVAALIAILRGSGVEDISIGESTFGTAAMTRKLFESTGYENLARSLGVRLVNFNESTPTAVPVPSHLATETVNIARDAYCATKIINIPVMKVHYATSVSLGLKNLKGFLVGPEKRRFHELGLDKAIADLARVLPVHLTIIDCIECMETMGPKGGEIRRLDTIVASSDIASADIVGCRIMGFVPDEVEHIKIFCALRGISLEDPKTAGVPISSYTLPFKRASLASDALTRYTIRPGDACSSCMNALILSARFLERNDRDLIVYLGAKNERCTDRPGIHVAFGNCCTMKDTDIRIKGCPPYPFELNDRLSSLP